jgi:hypothetical protein
MFAILNEWPHEKFFTPFHGFSAGIVRVLFFTVKQSAKSRFS